MHTASVEDTQVSQSKASSFRRFWSRYSRNRLAVVGLVIVILFVLIAAFSSLISPYSPTYSNFLSLYKAPTWQHWLGTDAIGRDQLSRIMVGLRNAFTVGFGAEAVELTLGLVLGAVAGYMGGLIDNILMRIVDVVYAFPSLLFSIILVVMLGHNLGAILIAVAATSWVGMARVVRSQVIKIRHSGYVEAAQGMGASWWCIIRRYVIPNSLGPILVTVAVGIPANMQAEAGLSLIGLGIEPPTPDLGVLISEGMQNMFSYPFLLWGPVVVFAVALMSFYLVADGFRDYFDTKSTRSKR